MNCHELLSRMAGRHAENLESAGMSWMCEDGDGDFDIGLLISEGERSSLFLRVLHAVVINARTELQGFAEGARVIADLERWYGRPPSSDPLVWWLKIALERYPLRLFVACDWVADGIGAGPEQDGFWFDLEDGLKTSSVDGRPLGRDQRWSTPDPRPWRGPPWRRFLGKRICFLEVATLARVLVRLLEGEGRQLFSVFLPGFVDEEELEHLAFLPLWLRLKWVEHLACRVRGLDWSYQWRRGSKSKMEEQWPAHSALRLMLDIKTGEGARSYRPSTLPPLSKGEVEEVNHGCVDAGKTAEAPCLRRITLAEPSAGWPSVKLSFSEALGRDACAILQMHREFHFETKLGGVWNSYLIPEEYGNGVLVSRGETPGVLFAAGLSGGLLSHNSLAALGHDSWSDKAIFTFFDVLESALFRVAVCDERFQSWWGPGDKIHTRAAQRRVFSVFWEEPSAYHQMGAPKHGHFGVIRKLKRDWRLQLMGSRAGGERGFLPEIFRDDPWPAAAEVLVIHQGIVDKWEDSRAVSATQELGVLKDDIPWVVVTSGRGKPDRVAKGVRFLPFSGLESCLVGEMVDKVLLTRQVTACGGEV